MADIYLRQEDLKALDQARQKLHQLSSNIGALKKDIIESNPLPEWESLQASASILSKNIRSMSDILAQHADLFQRVAVHPSSNYPGRTQEHLLPQLLRKKMEVPVEDWVNEGRTIQASIEPGKEKEDEELWTWARGYIGERVARYAAEEAGSNYTAEEREIGTENMRTGLRRKLDDNMGSDEESEDEDEDEEMEDVAVENTTVTATVAGQIEFGMEEVKGEKENPDGQARRLSDIMRYVTTGDPVRHYPTDRELEAKSNKSKDFAFS